ncbi:PLD nuclease N-terminal domain-containing protein [Rhodalgimonas zhirmunskyi]|uniref:PLD nuclease N-terminal domain-containing protein n=1 Tax=Rhodalgimonas zhirmunskyi TaxID=2964767 RepID=A0AAJ1UAP1_9RHOB|nr:PLD nuclease N-terminal domain-containing protein [Rhodoalgimonas zhirmunskyi]MDQ2094965.1 PLD nuclease N-terminal domain-containing protein [Rhodoalgimonas zhirmunskyi]
MEMNMFQLSGIGGLLLFILDVYAIINIVNSGASTGSKVIWTLAVVFLPFLGFIAWLIFGPRSASRHA